MGFSRGFFGFFLGMALLTGSFAASKQGPIPWDEDNKPTWFASDYEYHFKLLPLDGKSKSEPWSDTYWPNIHGGVAARWKLGDGFGYGLHSLEELKSMSAEEIAVLSPAEKYDIMNGRYDYPTVQSEWLRVHPNDPGWTGICHGWTAAASNFREPKAVTRVNRDGIEVQFGSSDVKAMLSYLYGVTLTNQMRSAQGFIGLRCYRDNGPRHVAIWDENEGSVTPASEYVEILSRGEIPKMDNCDDLNAGAFHVAIVNEIGLRGRALVGDVVNTSEVWNQPISGFHIDVLKDGITNVSETERRFGIRSKVIVQMTMDYIEEMRPSWNPRMGSNGQSSKIFQYSLDLNENGEILGGDWITDSRPDFLWKPLVIENLADYDSNLAAIYEPIELATPEPAAAE